MLKQYLSSAGVNIYVHLMGSKALSAQTVTSLPLDTPVYDDHVRFVCMSDTHNNADYFADVLPPGDVFLHAGDFTYLGLPSEVERFNTFLGNMWHCIFACFLWCVYNRLCLTEVIFVSSAHLVCY